MYADYNNCSVNLACSILKYYGAQYNHNTLPYVDALLENKYKNVVLLLFDGLGVDALNYHLPQNSFLRTHLLQEYSAVFPPTTTAATTTIESGLTPCEHGWLGWKLYFSEISKTVDLFINTDSITKEPAEDYHVAKTYIPYKSIYEKINETGNARARSVFKFGMEVISDFDEFFKKITDVCSEAGPQYIYGYWEYPDHTMHKKGCYDDEVTEIIEDIDKRVEKFCSQLSDTLVLITADHGHCNLTHCFLSDYPEILQMMKRPISMEPRAASFHIKPEFLKEFPLKFKQIFGDDFILYTKNEIHKEKIFGDGIPHPKFDQFIGDFLAVAISNKGLLNSRNDTMFLSHHAGMTEKEMIIPLIAVPIK